MKRSLICRAGALLVLAALMLALALPAAAEETTIRIRSAEDFCAFAEKCSYDAWSLGKTILLERDISLSGAAYLFIVNAYFIFLASAVILSLLKTPKVRELTEKEWKRLRFRMIRNTIIILIPRLILGYIMLQG